MTFADAKVGESVVAILDFRSGHCKSVVTGTVCYIHHEHGWFMIDTGLFKTCTFGDNCYTVDEWKALPPAIKTKKTRGVIYEDE